MQRSPLSMRTKATVSLVTYANGEPFVSTQRLLLRTASAAGINRTVTWDRTTVEKTAWGRRHLAGVPKAPTAPGCSTCAWKPYIILDELRQVRNGDWVLYADSSRYFAKGLSESVWPLVHHLSTQKASFGMVPGMRLRQRNNARINWRVRRKQRFSDSPYSRLA